MTGDDVRQIRFREALRGYHPDDVDRLLEQVATDLDAGVSPSYLLGQAAFRMKMRGYRRSDVDQLIQRLKAGG